MTSDISREQRRVGAARTVVSPWVVPFKHVPETDVHGADVLVLQRSDGTRLAARYLGSRVSTTFDSEALNLIGVYIVHPEGEPLSSFIDLPAGKAPHTGTHDWGAMGLPDGPDTCVRPMRSENRVRDDVAIARASYGNHRYASERALSLGAGDVVKVEGQRARVLSIDRRKGLVDVEHEGAVHTISLEAIAYLENE